MPRAVKLIKSYYKRVQNMSARLIVFISAVWGAKARIGFEKSAKMRKNLPFSLIFQMKFADFSNSMYGC